MDLNQWAVGGGSLEALADSLGKSFFTVRSYAYGHRRVPEDVTERIKEFTGGKVTPEDLKKPFLDFQNRGDSFGLVKMSGKRVGSLLSSIDLNASEIKKREFLKSVEGCLSLGECELSREGKS